MIFWGLVHPGKTFNGVKRIFFNSSQPGYKSEFIVLGGPSVSEINFTMPVKQRMF